MNFNVYSGKDDVFLIFPENGTASDDHVRSHGPLLGWGTVYSDEQAIPGLWERIIEEIAKQGFASVPKALGRKLVGLDTKTQRVGHFRVE